MLLIALVLLAYDSMHRLEVSEFTVASGRIPMSFDGFKIVQLSDLHGAEFGDELLDAVKAEAPDLIALTGDFITTAENLPAAERAIKGLTEISDVCFVSGNHDFGSGEISALEDMLGRYGVKYLKNEFFALERDGDELVIAGVEDPNGWADMIQPEELAAQLREEYKNEFAVLLGHRNYWMEEYPELPVDLILCGHAHGGLIRIPGVGGLVSTDRTLFPDYDAGLYDNGVYKMIVSRGLGNSVRMPRLLNRPEIVSITLSAK